MLNPCRLLQSRSPIEKAAASNLSPLCVAEGCTASSALKVLRMQVVEEGIARTLPGIGWMSCRWTCLSDARHFNPP